MSKKTIIVVKTEMKKIPSCCCECDLSDESCLFVSGCGEDYEDESDEDDEHIRPECCPLIEIKKSEVKRH